MTPYSRRWATFTFLGAAVLVFLYHNALLHSIDTPFFTNATPKPPSTAPVTDPSHSIDWSSVPEHHPVESFIPLPTGDAESIPSIQYNFESETAEQEQERQSRQNTVKEVFLKSWRGYKENAWLQDEVSPVSGLYSNNYGGWAATLVDNLDTLVIMGLQEEFEVAIAALPDIDFTTSNEKTVNVFESTIRYIGGLLSTNDLTDGRYPVLLEKAQGLGEMLYKAFDTPNRMPITRWDWQTSAFDNRPQTPPYSTIIAEVGSLSLEFTRLTQLTGDPKFFDAVQRITDALEAQQNSTKIPGLWPMMAHTRYASFKDDLTFTLGGMSDSLYEYFPKEHMLLGGTTSQYRVMYNTAIETAKARLFFRPMTPSNQKILISGSVQQRSPQAYDFLPEGQHLTCFLGGTVAIAAQIFSRPQDLETARQLVDGCIWAYSSMPTGMMPELFKAVPCVDEDNCTWSEEAWHRAILEQHKTKNLDELSNDNVTVLARSIIEQKGLVEGFSSIKDPRFLLRPEAIESIFILYRITGDRSLQDAAWKMFEAIIRKTETKIGNAAIRDVTDDKTTQWLDTCESFWMAETLKYFWLVFADPRDSGSVSLDEWVFNTEAHPFRRPVKSE